MPYDFYKVMHFTGLWMLFMGLGGYFLGALAVGEKRFAGKTFAALSHGLGLLLIIVSGFGLLAKGGFGFPGWIWGKLTIWLVLGGVIGLCVRRPRWARLLWILAIVLGALAAYLARTKPF